MLLFSSCTIEDEFTELTSHDDILVQTRVVFKDTLEDYDIKFVYYKTDGYNNLINRNISYGGSATRGREVFTQVFKEYKKVGLKIDPGENVEYITINFFEVSPWNDIFFQYHQDGGEEFTLMYDFTSGTHEVIQE